MNPRRLNGSSPVQGFQVSPQTATTPQVSGSNAVVDAVSELTLGLSSLDEHGVVPHQKLEPPR